MTAIPRPPRPAIDREAIARQAQAVARDLDRASIVAQAQMAARRAGRTAILQREIAAAFATPIDQKRMVAIAIAAGSISESVRAARAAFERIGRTVSVQMRALQKAGVVAQATRANLTDMEAALQARKNRHTGPRRDPYRHRGQ